MPNPNKLGTSQIPNQAPDGGETSRTRAELQATGQKPNRAVEQEGNRFLHISREELLKVDPSNLLPSEVPDFVAAHQAWIDKYQKIIDAAKEKEATLATEKEAALASETEAAATTEAEDAATNETTAAEATTTITPDLSGLDVASADQELVRSSTTEVAIPTIDPNAPTKPIGVVSADPTVTSENTLSGSESIDPTERISPETLAATKEKAKQKSSLKETLTKKVLLVVLSAAILISGIVGINAVGKNSNNQSNNSTPVTEQSGGTYGSYDKYDAASEQHEQHGIKDGYSEYGMYDDVDKANPLNFANASKVAEICNNNPTEMAIYTASNQVETLADYYTGVPDQNRPDFLQGVNTLGDMENRLQSASADDYDAALQQFANLLRNKNTTVENFIANGNFHNAYMAKSSGGATTHENVDLFHCVTTENGTPCTKFTFHDDNGNETGSIIIKTGVMQTEVGWVVVGGDGTLCMQKIDQNGDLYVGLTTIAANPDNPSVPSVPDQPNNPNNPNSPNNPNNPDDPDNPNKEWGKSGDPHSGPNRLPSDQVDPNSEISQEDNDAANRGHQGYVDDNQATPGAASENNGTNSDGFSNITAGGADTDNGRMSGNDQQGSGDQNGSNANAPTADQIARDDAGNAAQDNGNVAGGNNNSDEAEQDRVAGGQF